MSLVCSLLVVLAFVLDLGGAELAFLGVHSSTDPEGLTQFGLAMAGVVGAVAALVTGILLVAVLLSPRQERGR